MTKEKAISYCYKHKNEFVAQMFEAGEDGIRNFDCIINCLESGDIKPSQLSEYGMNFEDNKI